MAKRVAVLMGGFSSEREVSLSSGEGCIGGLERAGYDVYAIDVTRDIPALIAALDPKPDVVDRLLDMMEIPYTHSGALASAIAMDKAISRFLFHDAGVPLAPGYVITKEKLLAHKEPARPYVVKPLNEGSSVGVTLVFEGDNISLTEAADAIPDGGTAIIEAFIPGREIQTAVMGDTALGAIEIRTDRRFYDYVAKYTPGASTHYMPAPIHPDAYEECLAVSVEAHKALGCRGVSRVDLRYDDTEGEPGKFYVLEVNTQPGMTPTSLVPEIAEHAGISFEALVSWMVEDARCDG